MKKLLTVTFWSGLLTLARMASGLLVVKAVAIYVGPSGMAMLGQVQSLVGALTGIVTAPGGNALVRYTAQSKDMGLDGCAPWWSCSLKLSLVLLIPSAAVAILGRVQISEALFGTTDYAWLVVTVCIGLPFSAANSFVASVLNGQERYRRYVALGLLSVVASTTAMLILIKLVGLSGALLAAALSAAVSGVVMLLGSIGQPWFRLKYWWSEIRNENLRGVGGYVAMAITTAVTAPLSLMVVRKILVHQVGWVEAGHWQAVYKISEVYLGVITIALSTYFLPRLATLKGHAEIKKEISATAKVIMPLVFVIASGIYFLRDFVIALLFSAEFSPARELFAIQLIGDNIKIFSWLYAYPMLSFGVARWFIGTEIAFSLSFALLTYWLTGWYGVEGAVIAYAFNYLAYFFVVFLNLKRFSSN